MTCDANNRAAAQAGITVTAIPLSQIVCDATLQARAQIRPNIVRQYAERLQAGDVFPPLVVFLVGSDRILVDGYHRYAAAQEIALDSFEAELHQGNRHDALVYGLKANAIHGLPLSPADKRHAVEIALKELSGWSDRSIADIVKVSPTLVGMVRKQLLTVDSSHSPRLGADGKLRQMPKPKEAAIHPPAESPDAEPLAAAESCIPGALERIMELVRKETAALGPADAKILLLQVQAGLEDVGARLPAEAPAGADPSTGQTKNDFVPGGCPHESDSPQLSFPTLLLKVMSEAGRPMTTAEICAAAQTLLPLTRCIRKEPLRSLTMQLYREVKRGHITKVNHKYGLISNETEPTP